MTMLNVTASRTGLMARIAGIAANWRKSRAQYAAYRTTMSELDNLTDRELADLGIARAQIRSVAHMAAYEG